MKIWMFVVILTFPISVIAQDSCKDLLVNGFFNEYSKTSAQSRDQALYTELCSSDYRRAQDLVKRAEQSGASGSVGGNYGLNNLNASGSSTSGKSFSEDQFSEWKSQYCSKNTSSDASRASEFIMQKIVNEQVVTKWSDCMSQREGLVCWATPYRNEVFLNINWKKESLSQPVTINSYLSEGSLAHFENVSAGKIVPDNYLINPGTMQIPVTRLEDKSIVAHLFTKHDGVSHSCAIFVPGGKDFVDTEPSLVPSEPILHQQIIKSPMLGCAPLENWKDRCGDTAFGCSCEGEWKYKAPLGYQVCTVELYQITTLKHYKFVLAEANRNGGKIEWRSSARTRDVLALKSNGPNELWGNAAITVVPNNQNSRKDGRTCSPTILEPLYFVAQ